MSLAGTSLPIRHDANIIPGDRQTMIMPRVRKINIFQSERNFTQLSHEGIIFILTALGIH